METTHSSEPPKKAPPAGYRRAFAALGATGSWEARDSVPREHAIKEMIKEIALKRHIKAPPIYIYESDKPNAVSMPGAVAVATNMIDITTPLQLKAVLGHELSHTRHRWRDIPVMIGITAAASVLINMAFRKIWHRKPPKTMLGEAGLQLAEGVADVVGSALAFKPYGMFMEYEADREGAEIAGPQNMAGALTALDKRVHELSRHEPESWLKRVAKKTATVIFDIHPPMASRLERMRQMEEAQKSQPETQRAI